MTNQPERPRILRAIRKCLSDAFEHSQEAMNTLDDIGKGSVGTGMTPLVGGFAMKDPEDSYRTALIEVDKTEKSLRPLVIRFQDGRVNETHFENGEIMDILRDIAEFEYEILINKLRKREGRETVWYRLRELSEKIETVFKHVVDE